jgi:hypothetical protein
LVFDFFLGSCHLALALCGHLNSKDIRTMFIRDARLHVHQYMYVSETFLELTWIGKLDKTTPAPTAKTAKAAPPNRTAAVFSSDDSVSTSTLGSMAQTLLLPSIDRSIHRVRRVVSQTGQCETQMKIEWTVERL